MEFVYLYAILRLELSNFRLRYFLVRGIVLG